MSGLFTRLKGAVRFGRQDEPCYPATLQRRNLTNAAVVPEEGVKLFSQDHYRTINAARMDHLASLALPLEGKRVIDVGCGIGDLTEFFLERSCEVVCVDGCEVNISQVKKRFPRVSAHIADIDKEDIGHLGTFDIVFCYGLLYHLENPVGGLRRLAEVCRGMLLLETMVCDHTRPVALFVDEVLSNTQAMRGLGCRPSPRLVALILNRVGFRNVYITRTRPDHQAFQFTWRNNLAWRRDSHDLRAVFVAAHQEIPNPMLHPLLSD